MVVGNVVIANISSSKFGVRSRITAFDALDGHELWRTYSAGPDKDVGITANTLASPYPSAQGKDLGVSTWQGDEWMHGGGTTWGWYSYDPELNLFYHGSGNPGTWNPDRRPGDNKWSMSIWAQNPETGEVKWVRQMSPHDAWDYDGVNQMVLTDQMIGGKMVKALTDFDRNGIGYTLDRTNGKVLVAKPYGPTNWTKSVDLTTGRPVKDATKRTTAKGNTEGICPAAIGFKDQQPSAYSPKTKLFYVPLNNICMDHDGMDPTPRANRGRFIAWDAKQGRVAWEDHDRAGTYGGALATAGSLVLYGTMDGRLKAVDPQTGKVLLDYKTLGGPLGNPVTYATPDGSQFVAVLAGAPSPRSQTGIAETEQRLVTVFGVGKNGDYDVEQGVDRPRPTDYYSATMFYFNLLPVAGLHNYVLKRFTNRGWGIALDTTVADTTMVESPYVSDTRIPKLDRDLRTSYLVKIIPTASCATVALRWRAESQGDFEGLSKVVSSDKHRTPTMLPVVTAWFDSTEPEARCGHAKGGR